MCKSHLVFRKINGGGPAIADVASDRHAIGAAEFCLHSFPSARILLAVETPWTVTRNHEESGWSVSKALFELHPEKHSDNE